MSSAAPAVSLVITVYNEARSIGALLSSLADQSQQPAEIVICDGGSQDETVALIQRWAAAQGERLPPLRLLVQPGANISQGRNCAIRAAQGPLIAVTDAGVRLAPEWLAQLTTPWRAAAHSLHSSTPLAVAGFFLPDPVGAFETAMAATVLPLLADIRPTHFLPSSRSVAFLKRAWAAAGGYPEWLDYGEDLLFDFAINGLQPGPGTGFVFAPQALVYFRPRSSLRAFWLQYYRYARGDGKADLWRRRHAVRYATYLLGLPLLALLTLSPLGALGGLGLMAGLCAVCLRPWQRLWTVGRGSLCAMELLQALLWVPVIRGVGDLAKMAGYPVGLVWRWRNRHRPELQWRGALARVRNSHAPAD